MGRPFATHTPLGRFMAEQGWSVHEMSTVTGVNARLISDYLAARRPIRDCYLEPFADALEVSIEDLLGQKVQ